MVVLVLSKLIENLKNFRNMSEREKGFTIYKIFQILFTLHFLFILIFWDVSFRKSLSIQTDWIFIIWCELRLWKIEYG
jgi:hypothetical protein